jgi:hypothetical protein
MHGRRGWRSVAGVIAVGVTVVACGSDGDGDRGDQATERDEAGTPAVGPVELPFGLEPVEGTEPIGRVAVFDHVPVIRDGEPVTSRSLRAAYRVTADDPQAVFRAWAEQLDGMTLDELHFLTITDGRANAWVQTVALADDDQADLELWATDDGPVLLVSLDRMSDDPPRPPTIVDEAGDPPAPEPADIGPTGRTGGDVLFNEGGAAIHLPEGTTALMPTIPTQGGTGGSTSVLAAEDSEAAIDALLEEAQATNDFGDVDEPEVTMDDGVEVITAGFIIPAGGWGFEILSVQGPDDAAATLYVTSAAD